MIFAFPGHVVMFLMVIEGASLPFEKIASIACAGAERYVFVLASSADCHIAINDILHFFLVLEATFTLSNMSLVGFRSFFCGFLFIHCLQCHAQCSCLLFFTCNVVVWFNQTWSHFLDSLFSKDSNVFCCFCAHSLFYR